MRKAYEWVMVSILTVILIPIALILSPFVIYKEYIRKMYKHDKKRPSTKARK